MSSSYVVRRGVVRALWISVLLLALVGSTGCSREVRDDEALREASVPQVVDWEVASSHPVLLAGSANEQLVSITIDATLPESLSLRRRLNLSVVIDHSGSMTGAQMADARAAVVTMLESLDADDEVSVIAFSSQVEILMPQGRWGDCDQAAVLAAVSALEPTGTTAMSEALSMALQAVTPTASAEKINRVLLLSDGEANDPGPLPDLARWAQGSGVAITTLGLGPSYNEATLAMLADVSGGRYRFIESSQEIAQFFLSEMRAMEQVVARDAMLELTLGPNVELVEALGLPVQQSGRRAWVSLGALSAGEVRRLALRLSVQAGREGTHVEVLDATLRYSDALDASLFESDEDSWGEPMPTAQRVLSAYVGAESSEDAARVESSRDLAVLEAFGRLHAAREIEQGLEFVRTGRLEEGRALLVDAAARYRSNNVVAPVDVALDAAALEAAASVDELLLEAPEASETRDDKRPTPSAVKRLHQDMRSLSGL